jgi:hypothetical protein
LPACGLEQFPAVETAVSFPIGGAPFGFAPIALVEGFPHPADCVIQEAFGHLFPLSMSSGQARGNLINGHFHTEINKFLYKQK